MGNDGVKMVAVDEVVYRQDLYPRIETSAMTVQKYAEDLDVLPQHGAKAAGAQADTIQMLKQMLNDPDGHYRERILVSEMTGKEVQTFIWGLHTLRFSGFGPEDSEHIWWNDNEISQQQLVEILRFERSPYSLSRMIIERKAS